MSVIANQFNIILTDQLYPMMLHFKPEASEFIQSY